MKLYMYVTKDEFELPLAVEPSIELLAKQTGKKRRNISYGLYARKRGVFSRYICVDVEEDEELNETERVLGEERKKCKHR